MSMKELLLVEDDVALARHLCDFLGNEGFAVDHAYGQTEAVAMLSSKSFDCVLLDISLTDGSGFAICSYIRARSDMPVIFLTASGDEACTVAGFEMGADDYINKPFRPRELVARIHNAIRKKDSLGQEMRCGSVEVDTAKGKVTKNGTEIFLSALEYRLLLVFISNKGRLLSRDRLIEELWATSGEFVSDNTLTVYIKRLREKIEDSPQAPTIIKTVRGLGYKAGD